MRDPDRSFGANARAERRFEETERPRKMARIHNGGRAGPQPRPTIPPRRKQPAASTKPMKRGPHDERSTVDDAEVAHFDALAKSWWDPHGDMRALHMINPVRLRFTDGSTITLSESVPYVVNAQDNGTPGAGKDVFGLTVVYNPSAPKTGGLNQAALFGSPATFAGCVVRGGIRQLRRCLRAAHVRTHAASCRRATPRTRGAS